MRYPARFLAALLTCIALFMPIATVGAANLQITATVPAQVSNYSAIIASPTSGQPFRGGQDITYIITYGTDLSYNSTITITASWSEAVPKGASSPSVDLLTYIPDSASKAIDGTHPVIDTLNHTITWHIASLPAETKGATVSFHLTTSNTYISPTTLSFTVSASLAGPGVTTTPSTITQTFYNPTVPSSSTSMPLPSTPSQTTPTPTPTPARLTLNSLYIRSVATDAATIYSRTSLPSTVSLFVGDGPTSLSQQTSDQTRSLSHLISLTGLAPNTRYYFRLSATAADGQSLTSELYTFVTAQEQSNPPTIIPGSFIATSGSTILDTPIGSSVTSELPYLVVPRRTHFNIRIGISNISSLTSAQAFIGNTTTNTDKIELVPLSQGQYQGDLYAPFQNGSYDLIVRLTGTDGSITETKVAKVIVVSPLRIVDQRTGAPLPDSKVTVYFRNPKTGKFELITPSLLNIRNPLFSGQDGSVDLVLPVGTYQVKVSDLSYQDQIVTFTLGPRSSYPTVRMNKQGFSWINLLTYLKDSFVYLVTGLTGTYLTILTGSTRALFLTALLTLLSLLILTMLSFASRTKVSLWLLPSLILYHFILLFHRKAQSVRCQGVVVGENNEPLVGVSVFATSQASQQVVAHAATNRNGQFTLLLPDTGEYRITVMKPGYHPFNELETFSSAHPDILSIALMRHDAPQKLTTKTKAAITAVLDFSFEIVLLFSVTLELLIGMSLGWKLVIGFLLLSLFNLSTWIIYLHNQRSFRR